MGDKTCTDLRVFMNKLGELRKDDDLIVLSLNNHLPTKSFPGCKQSKSICEDFQRQLLEAQAKRHELIVRCCNTNEDILKTTGEPNELRMARMTLRQMRNELDVEQIVNCRATRAVHERCNTLT